jgi:tetratricopeptide (TPR) repeat protein
MRRHAAFTLILFLVLLPTTRTLGQTGSGTPTPPLQGQTGQGAGPVSPIVGLAVAERGAAAAQQGDYDRALLDLSLFILLNPTYSRGYLARASVYQLREQPEEALADLDRALQYPIASADIEASIYNARAQIYVAQERFDDALENFSRAIELVPTVQGYAARAELYRQQEQFDEALADYSRLIEIDPTAGNYILRGLMHFEMNRLEDALEDVDSAIQAAPQEPLYRYYRAQVNEAREEPAQSAADYVEYVRLVAGEVTEANLLESDRPVVITLEQGAVYVLPFRAERGQTVSAAAIPQEGASIADPILILLGTDGTPLAGNDDTQGETAAVIAGYNITTTGVYALMVTHSVTGFAGDVLVVVQIQE